MARREPKLLSRGRDFHRSVQAAWLKNAEGKVGVEKRITNPSVRRGRIDVFVADAGDGLVAVAEIKACGWSRPNIPPSDGHRRSSRMSRPLAGPRGPGAPALASAPIH